MSPTSRGLLLLRVVPRTPPLHTQLLQQRHASFRRPIRIPDFLRPQPKKTVPKVQLAPKQPLKAPNQSRTLFGRIRSSSPSKKTVRFLLWLPIIAVIYQSFPFAIWPIEGPSMQPTFNPSYTTERGTLNTKDHVLVHKQQASQTGLSQYLRTFFSSSRRKRADTSPHRGQIVVFITPHDPNRISVKRVVALPGDLVTPLPGYPGGESPVMIPYNHLWVEGDAGDPKKSIDSNTFGPISANLLVGRVLLKLPSLTPWINGTCWEDEAYPARDRVQDAVTRPLNPDEEDNFHAFRDGRILSALEVVKAYPPTRPLTPMERQRWEALYRVATGEKDKKDIETYELANALEAELRNKLSGKMITTTLKNVEMTRGEYEKFRTEGVVPEAVLKRSDGA